LSGICRKKKDAALVRGLEGEKAECCVAAFCLQPECGS